MFRKLAEKFKELSAVHEHQFDPATLDDPIALKTEWSPLKGGGANFCTRKLVQVSPLRYEFRASLGAKAFYLIFFCVGLLVAGIAVYEALDSGKIFTSEAFVLISVGLVFTLTGGLMFYFGTKPVVFDKQYECFWTGRIPTDELLYATANEMLMPFKEIYAIQLISEYISGNKSSYYSYEMNLVSAAGVRTNVVDHGKLEQIHEDAKTLSEFLDVPIWDGI